MASLANRFAQKTFRSLAGPDYRLLWLGFIGSWFSLQMQQVARGYLAYELTGSALALGAVTLSMGLPRIVLSPLGGVVADRYDKRWVLIWSQALLALVGLATALLVYTDRMTIWWLIVLGLFQGTAFSTNIPARQALIPDMLPSEDELPNAIALNTAGLNAMRLIAPSVAGILIGVPHVGVAGTFAASAVCYAYVLATLGWLRVPPHVARTARKLRDDLTGGFVYLWRSPTLLSLMLLGFVPLAVALPYIQLMPVFALNTLHVGAAGLGFLLTLVGLGGLVGTLATAYWSDRSDKGELQRLLGIVFGLALAAFAVAAAVGFWPGVVAALLVAGMTGDSYMSLNNALLLLNCEKEMYGRIMGAYMMLQSCRQISVLPIGALADWVGAPLTIGSAGILTAGFIFGATRRQGRQALSG